MSFDDGEQELPAGTAALDRWSGFDPQAADVDPGAARMMDAATVLAGQELTWLEQLERARRLGRDERLADLDDQALVAELGAQSSRVAAAMARYLRLVAELVIRDVWADHGARTPVEWLSFELGVGASTAADHVRVALRLRELPRIAAEFDAGRLSYTKVRAITRIAVPEIEELLLAWCRSATGAEVERLVRGFRRTTGPGVQAPDARRWLRSRANGDGTTTITVRLGDEEAAELLAACDRLIDLEHPEAHAGEHPGEHQDEHAPPDGPDGPSVSSAEEPVDPQVAELLALAESGAGVEIVDGGGQPAPAPAASSAEETPPTLHGDRSRSARRVDVLLHAAVATAATGGADTSGLDRHTLVFHAAADTIVAEPDRPVAVSTPTGRVRSMDAKVLRRLACESSVHLAVVDATDRPLDLGRRSRRPTAAMRRALQLRDRGCRFPGCGATRHLHAHHIRHWADDGPTDLDNLITLCSFHHRFVHDHGWTITAAAAGTFGFTPPGTDVPLPSAGTLDDADDAWWFDPDHGRPLRPVHRYEMGDFDLDHTIFILHQELRRAVALEVAA